MNINRSIKKKNTIFLSTVTDGRWHVKVFDAFALFTIYYGALTDEKFWVAIHQTQIQFPSVCSEM